MKVAMLIESDADTLMMISYILEDEGFQVVAFPGIVPANYIATADPDIVLIDHNLRGASLCILCRELMQKAKRRHIPIVLISAHEQAVALVKGNCANAYLPKPFDMDKLISTVRHLCIRSEI